MRTQLKLVYEDGAEVEDCGDCCEADGDGDGVACGCGAFLAWRVDGAADDAADFA